MIDSNWVKKRRTIYRFLSARVIDLPHEAILVFTALMSCSIFILVSSPSTKNRYLPLGLSKTLAEGAYPTFWRDRDTCWYNRPLGRIMLKMKPRLSGDQNWVTI